MDSAGGSGAANYMPMTCCEFTNDESTYYDAVITSKSYDDRATCT